MSVQEQEVEQQTTNNEIDTNILKPIKSDDNEKPLDETKDSERQSIGSARSSGESAVSENSPFQNRKKRKFREMSNYEENEKMTPQRALKKRKLSADSQKREANLASDSESESALDHEELNPMIAGLTLLDKRFQLDEFESLRPVNVVAAN